MAAASGVPGRSCSWFRVYRLRQRIRFEAGDESLRIRRLLFGRGIEQRVFLDRQHKVRCAQIGLELRGILEAHDRRRNGRPVKQPCQSDFRDRDAARVRDLPQHIHDAVSRSEEHTSELQSLMCLSYTDLRLRKTNLTYKT